MSDFVTYTGVAQVQDGSVSRDIEEKLIGYGVSSGTMALLG